MGRKTTPRTFQATIKQNITTPPPQKKTNNNKKKPQKKQKKKKNKQKNIDMAKKGKSSERNRISFHSRTEQRHDNYVKAKTDETQQISWWTLFWDWDETINHIISEWSKSAQKKSVKLVMTGWARSSPGNCAGSLNLTILINGICTPKNALRKKTQKRFSVFWDTNWSTNLGKMVRLTDIIKKKKNSHSTNTLGKGMNPIIFPPAMGK